MWTNVIIPRLREQRCVDVQADVIILGLCGKCDHPEDIMSGHDHPEGCFDRHTTGIKGIVLGKWQNSHQPRLV